MLTFVTKIHLNNKAGLLNILGPKDKGIAELFPEFQPKHNKCEFSSPDCTILAVYIRLNLQIQVGIFIYHKMQKTNVGI